MKTTKRILSLVLTVIMLFSVVPMTDLGIEASAEKWGDYSYIVLDDGTVTITEYTGNATELTIPSQINGRTVTRIGGDREGGYIEPFIDCDSLVSVVIPEGITHIFPYAFEGCDNLKNVTIPKSLIKLGHGVFDRTPFYNTGKWIDNFYVLGGCAVNLDYTKVTPDLYIPAEVKIIADSLIGTDVPFYTSFIVDEKNEYLSNDEYGVLYNKNKTILINYPDASKNKEFVIPDTVHTVVRLFSWYLESITIPDSVKRIESLGGPSIENIYIYGNSVDIDDESSLCYLYVNYDNWTKNRDEFLSLCDTYVLKAMNETLTDEEVEIFYTKFEELYAFWSDEGNPIGTIHCYPGSTAELYAKSKGIDYQYIVEDTKVKDETTGITAVFAPETFDTEVEMTIVESSTNADIAFKKLFGTYKSYDITFNSNGTEVQPNGKVTIRIPLTFVADLMAIKVYHVDENGIATLINSDVENGYVVFEADHFSEYVIVDTSDKHEHSYEGEIIIPATHTSEGVMTYTCSCDDAYTEAITKDPNHNYISNIIVPTCTMQGYTTYICECGDTYVSDYEDTLKHIDNNSDYKCDYGCGYAFEEPADPIPEEPTKDCSCNCHKGGLAGLFFKILNFFQKLFGMNKVCACGAKH